MDKIEKIRQEIERHLNSAYEHQNANPDMPKHRWYLYEGAIELCTDLLGYLDDTLSEEPDKSLEEAAYKYSFDNKPSIYGQVDVIDAFIAGAEWQKEQDQETIELAEDHAYLAGAEWQRAKMLMEAVEGEAEELYNDGEIHCTVGVGTYFKPGDKVYVLKAEEEQK